MLLCFGRQRKRLAGQARSVDGPDEISAAGLELEAKGSEAPDRNTCNLSPVNKPE